MKMNKPHVRAQLSILSNKDAVDFVSILNSDGTADKYILEDFNNEYRVDARSLLGVIYMCESFPFVFLVNLTEDGVYPYGINKFRPTDIDIH